MNASTLVPTAARAPRAWLAWAMTALAALLGLVFGFDAGQRMSGPMLGVVMALNAAVIAGLLFMVAWGLIDRREIARLWSEEKIERWPLAITFIATVTLSLEWAILLGITVALLANRFAKR